MQGRRVMSSLAVAATGAALLAGCGGSGTAKAPTPTPTASGGSSSTTGVKIDNFAFRPATLTAAGGTRVAVTNEDGVAHTLTADDGHSFDTGSIDPGSSSMVTAPKAGRYPFHCSIHPFMHGTLVVR